MLCPAQMLGYSHAIRLARRDTALASIRGPRTSNGVGWPYRNPRGTSYPEGANMTRSTPFRFPLFEISFAILAALAFALSPQAALAQHSSGGGGHASSGGHIGGGGGGHTSGGAGFGTRGYSSGGSHVSSPIHVFSGPRSAPAAAPARAPENSAAITNQGAPVSAIQPHSSSISVSPSSGLPRGTGMFADPRVSGEAARPMHTTIGFPPSTDPRVVSIASAHRGAPLMFTGQGQEIRQSSPDAAANRNPVPLSEMRVPQRVSPRPPHLPRRQPILAGPPFLFSSPGFLFFSPTFGFFGPGFGCDPFWAPSFGCNGFGYGGFGYLGYGNYLGGYGAAGYGYDGGYYGPPSFDVTPPGVDEGVSQEPAPSEWQNPPDENSAGENTLTAPDTIIYLKDGTSFAVKNYWVADGKLHYVTSYGGENAVDLGALDLQRTTDENAKQGIAITLRPAPDAQPPAAQPPNAQPQPPTQ